MRIVRHYDYGMILDSVPNTKGIIQDNMYFCFLELGNEKIICVHTYKSYDDEKKTYEWNEFRSVDKDGNDIIVGPYNIFYSQDYTFGEDFFTWHHRSMNTKHNYDELKWPTQQEKELVISYYENNLKPFYY